MLSEPEVESGLRGALETEMRRAVDRLGQRDAFLADPRFRIELPPALQVLGGALRIAGQGEVVEAFVRAMNRAAERAMPHVAGVILQAIANMSFNDARAILTGRDSAATEYFRRHCSEELFRTVKPFVAEGTTAAGATRRYKEMVALADPLLPFIPAEARELFDLDAYVTRMALIALFLVMAEEERRMRRDPMAYTVGLLRKMFTTS